MKLVGKDKAQDHEQENAETDVHLYDHIFIILDFGKIFINHENPIFLENIFRVLLSIIKLDSCLRRNLWTRLPQKNKS